MADYIIGGVMRAVAYSPNHIGNDTAIFNLVADQLRKRGMQVTAYNEDQLQGGCVTQNIIINMCREPQSFRLLQAYEDEGRLVINSGYGIENCTRERMTRILLGNGIPYPQSLIVNTDERVMDQLKRLGIGPCWVKSGELHTMHREDVSYARHPEEAQEIIQELFMRGFKRAVINRHIEGTLLKFYGVVGTPFFYSFFPMYSNSEQEKAKIMTELSQRGFDMDKFKSTCLNAAETLDIVIYGGDCIVQPDGKYYIIDFNDWPSFAPCRQLAATHIARGLMNIIKRYKADK